MITDPTAMNLYFVNLEGVRVLGINDETLIPEVHIELEREVVGCPTCDVVAVVNSRSAVRLIDLSMAGRKIALVWNKRRFVCRERECDRGTWTEVDHRIAAPRLALTDRAGRWATYQVGRRGQAVSDVAEELGCDSQTVKGVTCGGASCADRVASAWSALWTLTRCSSCARKQFTHSASPPRSWTSPKTNAWMSFEDAAGKSPRRG